MSSWLFPMTASTSCAKTAPGWASVGCNDKARACNGNERCKAGTFEDKSICRECPRDFMMTKLRLDCQICPLGFEGKAPRQNSCKECAPHYFRDNKNDTCRQCPAGWSASLRPAKLARPSWRGLNLRLQRSVLHGRDSMPEFVSPFNRATPPAFLATSFDGE